MEPLPEIKGTISDYKNVADASFYSNSSDTEASDALSQGYFLKLDLNPKRVFKFLIGVVCVLTALSLLTQGGHYIFGLPLLKIFVLDNERNLPTAYATLALAFCSVLLAVIAVYKSSVNGSFTKAWYGLSAIFLLLAFDEITSIHELLNTIELSTLERRGFFYFVWVIPAMLVVAVFAAIYFKFWRSLPSRIRNLFLLSGLVFLTGSLGMEMIGGFIASFVGQKTIIYAFSTTAEEFLEKMGIVFFIYTLLLYVQIYIGSIKIKLDFPG
jgi:hypothetical protein